MTDAGGTTYFVLDGATVVADVSAAGTAERFYNYYPGSYRLHSMREGSDGYLYLADGNANVLGLIDSYTGAVHASYSYTPFGRSDQGWQPGENRFRFASGEVDRLGLYYFRARYYSPELRRFISEDPIGLAGGVNPYMYAGNDPINQSDPTGLLSQEGCPGNDINFPSCPMAIDGVMNAGPPPGPVDYTPWGVPVPSWSVLRPGSLDVDAILAVAGGLWGIEPTRRRASQSGGWDRCAADGMQLAMNAAFHAAGLGLVRFGKAFFRASRAVGSAYNTGRAASLARASGVQASAGAGFATMIAVYPSAGAFRHELNGVLGGTPNPAVVPEAAQVYSALKYVPYVSLGIDLVETATSCAAAF